MNPLKIAPIFLGVLTFFTIIFGSFYTVDEGERAVVLRNAQFTGVSDPGLHWKVPFIDDARTISIRTQTIAFPEEPVYTADRQTATVSFSINYSALPGEVEAIYRSYGTLEGLESRILTRPAKEQIKSVFGRFTADVAIRERSRLNQEVFSAISSLGDQFIRVESVQIEDINFSTAVETAAEERARAEMAVQTKKQDLERMKIENQISVANAQAAADSQLAQAKAQAEATRLAGEAEANTIRVKGAAEASAIKAKSDAMSANPNLVELTKAERWNGALPTSMVPGGTIPFMSVK